MASIRTSLNLIDNMSRVLDRVTGKTDKMKRSIDRAQNVMSKETRIAYTLDSAGRAQARLAGATDRATKRLEQQDNQMKRNSNSTDILSSKLNKLMLTLGTAFSAKKIIALSDQMTATKARLDLMNDGLQTTAELQNKIFQSAQRARGSYQTTADAVAKMGILARDAFASNDEVIAFVEQLNKHFTIAGTSAQGIDAAMLQITQAMGQGVLRGEELNSVFEQAPTIIQSIAKYLDVPIGQIRSMAQEGLITADVVKQAMFATADETNAKFAQMPMTFAQVATIIGNTLLQTFEPVLQVIGRGAQWIYDNWSTLEPIFWGLAAAVGAYAVGTWVAKIAQDGLNFAMLKSPTFLVAAGIGILVGVIYKWIQSVGGIRIAWMITVDKVLTGWDRIKIGFMTGVYAVLDIVGKMKVETLKLLQSMVNRAIDIINSFIKAINKIPGVAVKTIDKLTFATTAEVEYEAKVAERNLALSQMRADALSARAKRQMEIGAAQRELAARQAAQNDWLKGILGDGVAKDIGKIADNTGAIKDSIDISQEDLKWLRDLAEQEAINRFTTATLAPQISIEFGDVRETADIDGIIGRLEEILTEEINIAAEGVHS
ncbi:tape measure protein [Tepidimicrobium xylanilyticum]|uniref:Tape measure domain-containing protein n=1 Tax=Tepidimicrobium xylanilyticum TaxID=1123352 RepID=A0A1H3EZJ0_9FIRM|nr:tape measure protein [Tepidimicrobium xylanilyticum]SDX84232.1 tape measure domain-containing protein [Tepidimicrobium xylanilyticum]